MAGSVEPLGLQTNDFGLFDQATDGLDADGFGVQESINMHTLQLIDLHVLLAPLALTVESRLAVNLLRFGRWLAVENLPFHPARNCWPLPLTVRHETIEATPLPLK